MQGADWWHQMRILARVKQVARLAWELPMARPMASDDPTANSPAARAPESYACQKKLRLPFPPCRSAMFPTVGLTCM
jgi:hypothetical protein